MIPTLFDPLPEKVPKKPLFSKFSSSDGRELDKMSTAPPEPELIESVAGKSCEIKNKHGERHTYTHARPNAAP